MGIVSIEPPFLQHYLGSVSHEDYCVSVSEMVPPTNSNKSGRSGGAYTSLGTRQERQRV